LTRRVFAAPADQPRVRRGTDIVLLAPAAAALAIAIASYPPRRLERAFERLLDTLPGWLTPVWQLLASSLWLHAAALIVAALAARRLLVVGQALAALALAAVLSGVATRLAVGAWPDSRFPTLWVGEAAAVIVTVSPHLVQPLRVLGRRVLVLGVVGAAVTADGTPGGIVAALSVAVVVAAGLRHAWGTSAGRPGLDDVAEGLAALGVPATGLRDAGRHVAGVFQVTGRDAAGRPLLVKVYGRDAADRQLLARAWRTIAYRRPGPSATLGRLEAAEHEALVTLLAARGGVATYAVETAGETAGRDALLVLRGEVAPLAADRAREAWDALALLGRRHIVHQRIEPATTVLVDGRAGFVDFGAAAVSLDAHQLGTDRAQLLVTTAVQAEPARAVAVAVDALGPDGVATLLPYLQAAAFSPSLRRALKAATVDVDELRKLAAAAAGVPPPALVKLRRVSLWSIGQLVLLAFAATSILTAAAHVDWDEVGSALTHASWGWLAVAVVVAQLPRLAQAAATLGTVPVNLPFGPVYTLHLASGYMNIALPSSVARMAVTVRFFQRQGLSATVSVASGVIDMVATFVVQSVLLLALLAFSEATLTLDLDLPTGDTRTLLWILIALLALVVAVACIGPVRRAIAGRVRAWWPDVRAALAGLRASNKIALLVLGNLAAELVLALALGLFAHALGYSVSYAELLVVVVGVALFSGLIPVPGGIGVAELGLTVGLAAAGLTPEAALATALSFRIATFYLPPVWGFFALAWLQRNRYL
jgi:uncharacterized membrane protein YbhN (UPF0104 family)